MKKGTHQPAMEVSTPVIRRGVAESAALLGLVGVVACIGAISVDKSFGSLACVALGGAALMLAIEGLTWLGER